MPTIAEALQGGWKLHQSGRVDDAEQIYRQVLANIPDQPEALVYLGIAQFDKRQFEQSAQSYRQALKVRDEFPIAWNNLGNSLRMLGEVDEAEWCFEKRFPKIPSISPRSRIVAHFGFGPARSIADCSGTSKAWRLTQAMRNFTAIWA